MAKIVGELKARLGLDKKKFDDGLKGAKKSGNAFGSAMKKVGGILAAAFAVTKIVQWGKKLLGLTDIQAKAEQSLLVALKGRKDIQQSLIKQASELQKKTLFGDEQTIEGAAKLAMLLGQDENAIKKLLPLVQDLATAKFGGNLVTAADMVAKSVGSSTNALTRYGIEITGAVGSSERLETTIAALNKQVGGQAEAAALVGTGAITQLKNIWGDYKEYLGSKLLPVMNKVAEWGKNFITNLAPKESVALKKEQIAVNNLVGAITSENISREARESLIKELQTNYPDFLGSLDAETTSNEELRDRLREVNDEYEDKLRLAVQQELVNKNAKEYADSISKEADLTKKLAEAQRILADTQDKIDKETNMDLLVAYIDVMHGEERVIDSLNKRIKKQQDIREELNDQMTEAIALLGEYKKEVKTIPGGGGTTPGGAPYIKTPAVTSKAPIITGLLGPSEEDSEALRQANEELAAMINNIFELEEESLNLGSITSMVFVGLADSIANSMFIAGDSLKAFGNFFWDFIKQMIARLIAAAIAALALAVALALVTGGANLKLGGAFEGMTKFGEFFKTGFKQFSGLASGGVIPGGYPGDTYPAMLSSGERVLTPSQNRQYESGMSGGGDKKLTAIVKGTDLYFLLEEVERRLNRTR